jgi:hypothetical protein
VFNLLTARRFIFLKLLRRKIQVRYLPPDKMAFTALIASVCLYAIFWRHFGTAICLPILADATPLLLALVGIIMSYIQPRRASHNLTTAVLIMAGLIGTVILSWNRTRTESAHQTEMTSLGTKVDRVEEQNTKLGNFLLGAKDTGKMSETDRKRGIENVLRNEYILSQNPVDPEILAGNQYPPEAWMNKRLREMGESWEFAKTPTKAVATTIIQQIAPEPKKAEIEASFYKEDMVERPSHEINAIVDASDLRTFNVDVTMFAIGTPAKKVQMWFRICKTCTWASEPVGSTSVPEHPLDREFTQEEMMPNVALPKITLSIKRAEYPRTSKVEIAFYYACDNCPNVDSKKPTALWVTFSTFPTPPFQSAPYIPAPVPQ